ncbi:thioredoxin family protein [Shouchella lonarensis]|uniref:Thioredoxin n=1 Tax=Shouchella lonarensis TaxID=1464122 RepID=A0A1G6HBI4_9BACI|nr:thioredoxin family protein [Shouchella lonarensis]SDB91504.1 Thioredoxin [Shouchella lonarensis]
MIELELAKGAPVVLPQSGGWLYVSSPFCLACTHVAEMLSVIEERKVLAPFYRINIQTASHVAQTLQIEQVPALLYYKEGVCYGKWYTFHSILQLLTEMKEMEDHVNGI